MYVHCIWSRQFSQCHLKIWACSYSIHGCLNQELNTPIHPLVSWPRVKGLSQSWITILLSHHLLSCWHTRYWLSLEIHVFQTNLPITYNNSFKHKNLRLARISISHHNFPLWFAAVFTQQWTDATNSRVKLNVFVQVKMSGVIFKILENLLVTYERWPFWRERKIWKCHHLFG